MEQVPDLSKGRARKVWIWVAAALVMLAIAAVLWWVMRRGRRVEARQRVVEAWARFERCLIGPPLAPGESPRARVRRIWLATTPPGEGMSQKEREGIWPSRCARYLDAVWSDFHESGFGDAVTDVFFKAAGEVKGGGEPGRFSSFDDLFAAVAKMGIPLGADARVPFPAEPVKPFRRDELQSLGSGWVVTWAQREGGVWRFLLDGKSLCEIDLGAAAGGCAPLAPTGGSDATVALAAGDPGAPPVIIVSQREKEGVFEVLPPDAKGERPLERLHDATPRGAYGRGHGAVDLLLGDPERGFELARIRGGRQTERIPLPVARRGAFGGVELIDDAVVWAAVDRAGKPGRLWRATIPPSGPPAAAEPLGELPAGEGWRLAGCRQGDTRAVLVGAARGAHWIAVRGKHGWGKLQPIEADNAPAPVLTCRAAGVVLTWKTLRRVRCTNAECAADGVTLELVNEAVAADIGERGAVVHGQALHGGRPGGVRLRVAPVDRLHGVADRLILDDGEDWHDGLDPAELYLFGGPEAGLLLVPELMRYSLFAFRVAPDGAVTPVKRR